MGRGAAPLSPSLPPSFSGQRLAAPAGGDGRTFSGGHIGHGAAFAVSVAAPLPAPSGASGGAPFAAVPPAAASGDGDGPPLVSG